MIGIDPSSDVMSSDSIEIVFKMFYGRLVSTAVGHESQPPTLSCLIWLGFDWQLCFVLQTLTR